MMTMMSFSDEEWVGTMNRLAMLASLLEDEPLGDMIQILDRIDSVGPILDPTAYRTGMKNIDDQRKLLRSLQEVQITVRELKSEAK